MRLTTSIKNEDLEKGAGVRSLYTFSDISLRRIGN